MSAWAFNPGEFHRRLCQAWYHSGLTMLETAKRVKRSRKSIERYMSGESMPDARTLAELCAVFKVSADWMLYGEGGRPEWWT